MIYCCWLIDGLKGTSRCPTPPIAAAQVLTFYTVGVVLTDFSGLLAEPGEGDHTALFLPASS